MATVSAIEVVSGLFYLMVGMAQLLQPEWYFANVGGFPPYNRLVIGQLGSVLLPLGVLLVIASQNPTSNRMMISLGAATATLMTLNHLYGMSISEEAVAGGSMAFLPLTILAVAQLWAFWQIKPRLRRR
jgi:hypothetical protein